MDAELVSVMQLASQVNELAAGSLSVQDFTGLTTSAAIGDALTKTTLPGTVVPVVREFPLKIEIYPIHSKIPCCCHPMSSSSLDQQYPACMIFETTVESTAQATM